MKLTQPVDEKAWNELAYKWARYLRINWYHAVADLKELRTFHGERGAFEYVKLRLETSR